MALAGSLVLSLQVQTNDSLEKAVILHAMLTRMIDMVRSSGTLPPPHSHIKGV
jgi:hypothetical protein